MVFHGIPEQYRNADFDWGAYPFLRLRLLAVPLLQRVTWRRADGGTHKLTDRLRA